LNITNEPQYKNIYLLYLLVLFVFVIIDVLIVDIDAYAVAYFRHLNRWGMCPWLR
jgi:hypothetical protein